MGAHYQTLHMTTILWRGNHAVHAFVVNDDGDDVDTNCAAADDNDGNFS